MLEKVSQLAEQAATNASRRQFLGRLGRAAAGAAGILGGLLLVPADAHAARRPPRLCSENSFGGCAGLYEGSSCFQERAFGRCVGTKRKGDKGTITDCYCDAEAPR